MKSFNFNTQSRLTGLNNVGDGANFEFERDLGGEMWTVTERYCSLSVHLKRDVEKKQQLACLAWDCFISR